MRDGVPYEIVEQGSEKIKEYIDLSYEHEDIHGRINNLEKRIEDKRIDIVKPLIGIKYAKGFNQTAFNQWSEEKLLRHLLTECTMQDYLILEQDIKSLIELQLDLQKWKYKLAEVRNSIRNNGWEKYL